MPATGVPPSPEPDPTPDPTPAIRNTVIDWAAAWSDQRVDEYLGFYGREFQSGDGMSRSDWEAQRRLRVLSPASIRVGLSELSVEVLDAGRAVATFDQRYESDRFTDRVRKRLELALEPGGWRIVQETVEP